MPVPQLPLAAARLLHLSAQGLLKKPRRRAQPDDIFGAIMRMSLLQIDTINVVARSPYLVLFSRLGAYPQVWLDDALSSGQLMEYWAHEACFLPRSDFALVRHRMLSPENMGWKYRSEWMQEHREEIAELIAHIARSGPVRSADFKHAGKGASGWWAWKPYKRHLEGLFTAGQLTVTGRHNFQRIYDLTARVMPYWDDERDLLTQEAAEAQMLRNSARSLGIFRPQWLADYYRLRKTNLSAMMAQWHEEGLIAQVNVDSLGPMWLHQERFGELEAAQEGRLTATRSAVLSPFDPVVWDRARAEQLFDFRYRLECYTPAPKRQFGYFALPLLRRGSLVGRMDCKMHRRSGVLEIIALYLEEGVRVSAALERDLSEAINDFARWQGATRVAITRRPTTLFCASPGGWDIDAS